VRRRRASTGTVIQQIAGMRTASRASRADRVGRPGRPRGLVDDARQILRHLPEQELDAKATEAVASLTLLAEQEAELAEDSGGTLAVLAGGACAAGEVLAAIAG
jgi:hypothetical protein